MVSRLELAHGRFRRRIQSETERQVRQAWIAANGVDEERFVEEAFAAVESARVTTVGEVDAFLAAYLSSRGFDASPQGLDPAQYRRPVDPDQQWRRPFTQMRTRLSEGMEFPQAFQFAQTYAAGAAATDLQLASRGASRDWMVNEPRVVGYRRVLGSGGMSGENCGLCVVASTQRYHKGDLMPIHVHCTCETVPMMGEDDPGHVLDNDSLDVAKDRVAEMDGAYSDRNDLGRVRINADELPRPKVVQHGEMGPVIYDERWSFTGPDQVSV